MMQAAVLAIACVMPVTSNEPTSSAEPTFNEDNHMTRQEFIPKILHHIFLGTADFGPPLSKQHWNLWQENVRSCLDRSPEFKHILWNNSMVLDMLQQRYPDHVQNYNSYSYGVQRADAARYFILYEYGGVYIDMDMACDVPLNDVIAYVTERRCAVGISNNKWMHGVSNDVLISTKGHRFFKQTISSLSRFNINYGLPHATVMFSTGPNFLTAVFQRYLQKLEQDGQARDVVVFPTNLTHGSHNGFLHPTQGKTWYATDSRILDQFLSLVFFIWHIKYYSHVLFLVVCVVIVVRHRRCCSCVYNGCVILIKSESIKLTGSG